MSSSTDNTDLTILSSTSGVRSSSHAPIPRENQRIRSIQRDIKKTYPSPPPSPPRPKRTTIRDSGLDTRAFSKVTGKRRCSGVFELGGNHLHPNHTSGNDMTPDSQLENGKAISGTRRPPAGHSNGHEQVRNVGSNTTNPNAAKVAGNGYSSPVNIVPMSRAQTSNPPTHKKRRYFEVDPLTGEERITEIMDGLDSSKGGVEKRVYALPSYAPSHSRGGSHQSGGSASPPRTKTPLGAHERNPVLPRILPLQAELGTPEAVFDRKQNIFESPGPMPRAVSLGIPSATEEQTPNGAVAHITQTVTGSLPEAKKRREPPAPLSLADDVGNFATLASSRERRQLPNPTLTPKEPVPSTPGKMPTAKSVPATPLRAHSRKNSHSSHTIHLLSPDMRPLSPISPPRENYVPRVPDAASGRIIGTHVGLYAMRNGGVHPPGGLPRRGIKGTYRLPMATDKPDLGDFIVLKHSEVAYWEGGVDAGDTRMQSGEECETSSADVERWSSVYVKGPKYRARPKPKRKSGHVVDVVPVPPTIPNNIPKPDLSKKPTLQINNSPNVLSSMGQEKDVGHGAAAEAGDMDLGVRSRPARKLSSLIVEDEDTLVDDPMDEDYGPRVGTASGSRLQSRGGISISSATEQLSTGRPQRISAKYRTSSNELSSIAIPVATASSPYPFMSDTEISSDEDIIPAASAFGHGTATTLRAPTKTSFAGQSREQRKQDRINAVRLAEGGPGGEGFRPGSSSIFSIVQLAVPGVGVMGPPAAKVSQAEYRLYIGRRGDQAPLFGSGGNMVVPGLGSGSFNEHIVVGGDSQHGGTSLFQPGGIVEVRRVEDPLLEATMEVKRLIYENGHQGGLAPAQGVLGGLSVEKVYWSGEREASLTKPLFGIGVDFSGRPLVKALTFSNPLTNHSYTLSFVWAFLPVNTPEKNKENAVGNSMLLSDEVKGEGASNIHADDIRASFQVHLCVGKPGRVQKKEERKRIVFVQFPNAGKGGKSSKNAPFTNPVLESIQWERWELDGLMRGLTRLWLERTKPRQSSQAGGLPRTLKRSFTGHGAIDSTDIGDSIGNWLERDVLGLESELPNGRLSSKPQAKKTKILQDQSNKLTRPLPTAVRIANVQTTLPMYLQAADSRFTTPGDLPPPLTPPTSPRKKILNANGYGGVGIDSEAARRGKRRKGILMKELSEVLPEVEDAMMASEDESEMEDVCWW